MFFIQPSLQKASCRNVEHEQDKNPCFQEQGISLAAPQSVLSEQSFPVKSNNFAGVSERPPASQRFSETSLDPVISSTNCKGMVEALKLKLKAWEKERGSEFLYDGDGVVLGCDTLVAAANHLMMRFWSLVVVGDVPQCDYFYNHANFSTLWVAARSIILVPWTFAFTWKMKSLATFQHDPNCMVLLMDGSAALGLDLSFVNHVYLMEPIWDRSLEEHVVLIERVLYVLFTWKL